MDLNIQLDKKTQRFYVEIDNKESVLKYKKLDEQTLDFFTTFVPIEQRDQGIAAKITDFALQYAKKNDYKVIPTCSFVKSYIDSHPEYQSLIVRTIRNKKENKSSFKKYWPLLSLIIVSIVTGLAINWQADDGMRGWMHYFMGVFLVMFSTLKIFHPVDFANGFGMYDIIAKRSRIYAYCYPLIELILGLAFLSFFLPILTYFVTLVILTVGSVGVIQALKTGLDINCPCMGTILDVPLSTVTLTENIGMALMALILLIISII